MPGAIFLEGEDLSLRTIKREDLGFLHRYRNEPAVRRWLPHVHPERMDQTQTDFEETVSDAEETNLLVCIETEEGPERAGYVTLFDVSTESGRGTIAAWLAPEYHGEGYGKAATALLLDHAFFDQRLHKVMAGALATNDASRGTLESLGFEQEGTLRDHYFVKGEHVDRAVYGMLAAEWRERRERRG